MSMMSRSCYAFAVAGILVLGLLSCEFSRPPAPGSSKNLPVLLLKFSSYSQNNALVGYFTLGDASTNQVAADGRLRIHVYTSTMVNLGTSSSPPPSEGLKIKNTLYDNTFAIGTTNFHWETFGSIFTVKDLACRFVIPYAHFKTSVRRGRVATIQIEFRPDGGSNSLLATRNASLY